MKTMTMKKLTQDNKGCCYHNDMMLVVCIIGIAAAIAIPRFAYLIRKSNEGASKGNLGAIRSALLIHGDRRKAYPPDLATLTEAKIDGKMAYLERLPEAKTPNYHADSARVTLVRTVFELDDTGGWAYVAERKSPDWGTVLINCTHTDTKGEVWSRY